MTLHRIGSRRGLVVIGVLLTARLAAGADPTELQRFLWSQANVAMGRAEDPQEFAEAAALYRSLFEQGHRSAAFYRNYGTALLLAEAPGAAAEALRRAENLGGSRPDLRRNLRLALTLHTGDAPIEDLAAATLEPLHWSRVPFFWHYQAPLRWRVTALLAGVNGLWLALMIRWRRRSDGATALCGLVVVALAALVASVGLGLRMEFRPFPTPVYRWQNSEVTS